MRSRDCPRGTAEARAHRGDAALRTCPDPVLARQRLVEGRGDGDLDRTFEVHADLTFEGDGAATLVLDGAHAYAIDLATGVAVKIR